MGIIERLENTNPATREWANKVIRAAFWAEGPYTVKVRTTRHTQERLGVRDWVDGKGPPRSRIDAVSAR